MNNHKTFLIVNYFNKNGIDYKIGVTRKKANKRTRIHCKNNHVIWEQIYPLGRSPVSMETVICQPSSFMEKKRICVLVIAGKPDGISGLEEGVFLSAQSLNGFATNKLYVMSEKAFSKLDLQLENL